MSGPDHRSSWRGGFFVRMLGSAVVAQALLSAGNLSVGLILIRRATDHDYGSYVLVLNALILITQAQNQFIQPAMVLRMSGANLLQRAALIGGLFREQRRLLPLAAMLAAVVTLILRAADILTWQASLLTLAAIAAGLATLYREFFRLVLLAYRRPVEVLQVDALYVVMLVAGTFAGTLSPVPALATVLTLCLSASTGALLLGRALWRHEPWNIEGAPVLRSIAPIGAWTVAGSGIHWTFTQGYNYLVAGTLSVPTVAAVAATRLLMMPVNMLSTGVGSLMLPTTSAWQLEHGPRVIFTRLLLLCVGLAGIAWVYFGGVWLLRDWLFTVVLKKEFPQRDLLVSLWFGVFTLMIFRDQLLFLPLARGRYRVLTGLTMISAVVSLTVSYLTMVRIGMVGAVIGVIIGEAISVVGLLALGAFELRKPASSFISRTA
jgi:O-antigen/teichoic acid export membrane protein